MDIIKPRSKIFQSNYLTETYLPFTKTESDLFAIMISTLKADKFEYEYSVKQLLELLRITDNNYMYLIEALEGLSKKQIKFDYYSEKQRQRITNVIDYIDYPIDKESTGINDKIVIQLTRGIIPHLFNLKENFTVYEVQSFLALKSTYSKKLYTIFAQYKGLGKLTKTPEEIQTLIGTNYRDFRVLLSKVIKPCIEEIQLKTNIKNIVIEPLKKGRKIEAYKFVFDWVNTQLELALLPPSIDVETVQVYDQLINEYRLTKTQATLIIEHLPVREIRKTFYDISIQKVNNKIDNIGGYTLAIFRNKFKLNF